MKVQVLAVGRQKDGPERDLTVRYLERARAAGKPLGLTGFDVAEIPESRATRPADRKAEEAAQLRLKVAGSATLALDERGAQMSSEAFADWLAKRRDSGARGRVLVSGGADGLDPAFAGEADERLAFGRMTLPHQIVRILAAEQLYRAMTILSGHPYHRS